MYTRICALKGCDVEFQTDNKIKKHCCSAHSTLNRVRRWKAKHRKGKGGGGGGGGGGAPRLFNEPIETVDAHAFFPGPITGNELPDRKPSRTERSQTAAA
jgi:hypothetical protein